jgi:hypothetical protein
VIDYFQTIEKARLKMLIEETIGGTIIKVGTPSKNHVTLINAEDPNKPVEIHTANWETFKIMIDEMFRVAETISKIT